MKVGFTWNTIIHHNGLSRDEVPQNVKTDIGTVKFMLTVIWGINGFHVIDLMPAQCRFNSQYFV
jgi:hypothetical protein